MQNLETLREMVERLYTSGNPDADVWADWAYPNHVLVVAGLTERLAKAHGANVELAVAGALLHDVADAVMARKSPDHEAQSLTLAEKLLRESGFSDKDTKFILTEVIKPHGCNDLMPTTLEGKVMASADGAAHFLTDFFLLFCWRHYGPKDDYQAFKAWALVKMEKHYHRKLFFEDIKREVTPRYEALKLIFS
jgi:putative nucleotidyltransferase with HDIG domain